MTGDLALRDLKHYGPELVRCLRCALDVGCTPAALKRNFTEPFADVVTAAIDHMAAYPTAGTVRWEGDEFIWVEDARL